MSIYKLNFRMGRTDMDYYVDSLYEFESEFIPNTIKECGGINVIKDELDRYYSAKYIDLFRDNLIQEMHDRDDGKNRKNIYPEIIGVVGSDKIRKESGEICEEKMEEFENIVLDYQTEDENYRKYLFDKLQIRQAVIRYDNDYILCGQCKVKGGRRCSNDNTGYVVMGKYDDKVTKIGLRQNENDFLAKADWTQPRKVLLDLIKQDKDLFNEDTLETYAWIPIKKVRSNYKIKSINPKDLHTLMGRILCEI